MYSRLSLMIFLFSSIVPRSFASPLLPRLLQFESNAEPTPVPNDFVASTLLNPALFTRVAYCPGNVVTKWDCGVPCAAVRGVQVLKVGGNDNAVPNFFVAYVASMNTVVVAHRGTDPEHIKSILDDAKALLVPLDTSTSFAKAKGKNIRVHDGFQKTFKATSNDVLKTVQSALVSHKGAKVLVTGHSLGAAIATFDGIMLKEKLDPSVNLLVVVFGLPRVGTSKWAEFVREEIGPSFHRVSDRKDPIVDLPAFEVLGYVHPEGETHIKEVNKQGQATSIVNCPGQENNHCSKGNSLLKDVFTLKSSVNDHLGSYFKNITFGVDPCTPKE